MEKFSPRNHKEEIFNSIRPHIILNEGKDWTKEQYEQYFMTEYMSPCFHFLDEKNFYSWKSGETHLWIQDFVSDNAIKAYCLYKRMKETQENLKKDLRCQCAITNIHHLTILIRLGFKIIDLIGYNYILEEKYKNGRKKI